MSLNLPTPPTNNLYIFCAIFGLSIIIASFMYADHSESEARKKVIEFSNYSSDSLYETNNFAIGFEDLSENEKQKIRNKLDLNRAKFETLASQMLVYGRKFDEAKNIKYIGGAFGFVVSALGFFFWYRRNQIINDKILRNQSKPSRLPFKKC